MDAGFWPTQAQVFQGEAGAAHLDLKRERHGAWVHFRRELDRVFADETAGFDKAEAVHSGSGVLQAHGGQAVRYRGSSPSNACEARSVWDATILQ